MVRMPAKTVLALSDSVWYIISTIHILRGRTYCTGAPSLYLKEVITIKVLSFDPSGNYNEGSGTSGWAVFEDGNLTEFGTISASDFSTIEGYWNQHYTLIAIQQPNIVVCESFRLFAHKQKAQTWSQMETPQLIGYLRMMCWKRNIKLVFQQPSDKLRVTDPILVKMGVFEMRGKNHYCNGKPTNLHIRDAIRHGVYYNRYRKD